MTLLISDRDASSALADAEDEEDFTVQAQPELTLSDRLPPSSEITRIGSDVVMRAAQLYPHGQGELLLWSYEHAVAKGWSFKEAAKVYHKSDTYLLRIWTGKYIYGPNEAPERAGKLVPLDKWMKMLRHYRDMVDKRAGVSRLPFIETSTVRKISAIMEKTLVQQNINTIIGETQIGKTTAIEHLAAGKSHIYHVRTPSSTTFTEFLRAVGEACDCIFGNATVTRKAVKKKLNEATLLVLDRVHFVFETYTPLQIKRVLAFIQELKDDTGCAILLVGTKVWMEGGRLPKFAATFLQISYRGDLFQLGAEPSAADIKCVADFYGLPFDDAAKKDQYNVRQGTRPDAPIKTYTPASVMKELAGMGMGKLTKLFATADTSAKKKEIPLDWGHVIEKHDLLTRVGKEVR